MASSPTFVLLGPFEMRVDRSVVPIGTPQQRAVLAALAITAGSWRRALTEDRISAHTVRAQAERRRTSCLGYRHRRQ
jgi:hypothetical protein